MRALKGGLILLRRLAGFYSGVDKLDGSQN